MSEEMFSNLVYFIENIIKIKNNPKEASFNTFRGSFKGIQYISSFGKGNFANIPWIAFLSYGQEVSNGIYPVILYNTKTDYDNFEICYGVSSYNRPKYSWNLKFIANAAHSKTSNYKSSFLKSAYTINSIDDLNLNINKIIQDLNAIINDYKENFSQSKFNTKTQYWLYAAGEKSYKWEEFYKENIMALGWDNLGNLKNYHSQDEIAKELQKHGSQDSYPMNNSKANWEFVNKMNIGDIVYVKQGLNPILLGRGVVESDYIYDNTRNEYKSIRRVNWTHNGIYDVDFNELDIKHWNQKALTDISENKYKDFCKKIEKIFNDKAKENKNMSSQPLNQILYGPPGTGKTYNTIIKAMEIINGEKYDSVDDEEYKNLKLQFNQLKQQGQIEFVTFHQSYSYEEFVEGIKPNLENENDLKYKLQDGIFKKICQNATKKITDNFDEVYEKFINDLADYNEDNLFKLKTGKGKIFGITVNSNKNLSIYMGKNLTKWGTLTKDNLKNLSDWKYYANPIYEYLKNNYSLVIQETQNSTQPYVLIIDEINRGNISKIFGELITLIEEDKRETLSIKLTYSPNDYNFTVPKNLYIIGTMNTSDRSIASIDIALRRRFKFVEMMPRPELVADFGCGFQSVFEKLNAKIKILLDRDHQIGHSYFINTKYANADVNTLKEIWFSEIIPLLNEYFYCDWEKLKLVTPGFIKEINIPEELKNECEDSMYEFKTPNEVKDFVGALKQDKFKQEN